MIKQFLYTCGQLVLDAPAGLVKPRSNSGCLNWDWLDHLVHRIWLQIRSWRKGSSRIRRPFGRNKRSTRISVTVNASAGMEVVGLDRTSGTAVGRIMWAKSSPGGAAEFFAGVATESRALHVRRAWNPGQGPMSPNTHSPPGPEGSP